MKRENTKLDNEVRPRCTMSPILAQSGEAFYINLNKIKMSERINIIVALLLHSQRKSRGFVGHPEVPSLTPYGLALYIFFEHNITLCHLSILLNNYLFLQINSQVSLLYQYGNWQTHSSKIICRFHLSTNWAPKFSKTTK